MKSRKAISCVVGFSIVALIGSCSATSMKGSGGGGTQREPPANEEEEGDFSRIPVDPAPSRSPSPTPPPIPSYVPPPILYPTPVAPSPTPVQPETIVDGMEVFTDCGRCLARAKSLAPQMGFSADITRTANCGFYKIDPSRGLCDIHFLANAWDRIQDHEGRDSMLNQQIALYCPCNCGWGYGGC